jgi:hypothetical protein
MEERVSLMNFTTSHMIHGHFSAKPSAEGVEGAARREGASASRGVAVVLLGGFLFGFLPTVGAAKESASASPGNSLLPSNPKSPSGPSPAPAERAPLKSPPREIPDAAALWDSVADLEGDSLLAKAADLGLLNEKLQSLYQGHLRDRRTASELVAGGLGENHPDVRGLNAGLDRQRRQLMAAVQSLRENAQTVRTLTTDQLAAAAIPVFHLSADQATLFHWGKPSNGLRLALSRPESVGEKSTGALFDYRMIIQNVSDDAITLDMTRSADRSPRLILRKADRTLAAFTGEPRSAKAVVLPPNSAASVPLFPNRPNLATIKAYDPSVALSVELELSPTPGAWSGRLVSPETLGLFTKH